MHALNTHVSHVTYIIAIVRQASEFRFVINNLMHCLLSKCPFFFTHLQIIFVLYAISLLRGLNLPVPGYLQWFCCGQVASYNLDMT